jgi:hypothetical protein
MFPQIWRSSKAVAKPAKYNAIFVKMVNRLDPIRVVSILEAKISAHMLRNSYGSNNCHLGRWSTACNTCKLRRYRVRYVTEHSLLHSPRSSIEQIKHGDTTQRVVGKRVTIGLTPVSNHRTHSHPTLTQTHVPCYVRYPLLVKTDWLCPSVTLGNFIFAPRYFSNNTRGLISELCEKPFFMPLSRLI